MRSDRSMVGNSRCSRAISALNAAALLPLLLDGCRRNAAYGRWDLAIGNRRDTR